MDLYVRPLNVEEHAGIYAGALWVVLGWFGGQGHQWVQKLDRSTQLA